MVPLLLLLSLFITHLAVGGELLQHSTDIVYVSANGTDDSSCLIDGGSHCKSLGYVLTNIPMLQCSNCTVTVTYDHIVGLPNISTLNTVNISNIEVLYIVGLGQPSLYFNGSGLLLVYGNSSASVVLESIKFIDCNADDICIYAPPGVDIFGLSNTTNDYLLHFNMTNVAFNTSAGVIVIARYVLCQRLSFINVSNGLKIAIPGDVDSEISLLHSTFENSNSYMLFIDLTSAHQDPRHSPSVSAAIRGCQFKSINADPYGGVAFAVGIYATTNHSIDLVMDDCVFESCHSVGLFGIIIDNLGESLALKGLASITNNYITNNTCSTLLGCVTGIFICNRNQCANDLEIRYIDNIFSSNAGNGFRFYNWELLGITDSLFKDNSMQDYVFSMQYSGNVVRQDPDMVNVSFHNLTFRENSIITFPSADKGSIMMLENDDSYIYSLTFSDFVCTGNRGTPLLLVGVIADVIGDVLFSNNSAITGGGVFISYTYSSFSSIETFVNFLADNITVSFINNIATYGGAIYADQDYCFISDIKDNTSVNLTFSRNRATFGNDVFSSYDWCSLNRGFNTNRGCRAIQNLTSIASPPTAMSFNGDNSTTIFPGQTITGNMQVTDCLNHTASCRANSFFLCPTGINCSDYILDGPSSVTLHNGTVDTGLTFNITKLPESNTYLTVQFVCRSPIRALTLQLLVNVTLLANCPVGLEFDLPATAQCQCTHNGDSNFICSRDEGMACIRRGYWYDNVSKGITRCVHLFCDYSGGFCPSTVSPDSANFVVLGSSQDDQCLDGHGGTLCTGCAHNKLPTYGALQCIDSDKCAKWQPYVLLLLNIVIPFIDVIFLVMVIRLKLSIGSGYLYGPLFYLAVLNLIPLTSYNTLKTIVSSFVATILLKLNILGYIPWCIFHSVSLLTSMWFEFIAPSVVISILSLIALIARCCPKVLGRFQKSPLQAMCLLMFVLFWSLASTAISVITPVYLSGVKGVRVHLQPDLAYLSGGHIPLWIISVIILLVLYSIVFVLTFSRFLNLHRLKPVLDEFQSCYRDSYRWYGGVYFIMWTVLQIMALTSSYQLFKTLVIVHTVTHSLLQPYSKKWLNMMDGFLLGSLSVTSSLVLVDSSNDVSTSNKVIVYASVMLPLFLIVIGLVAIVVVKFDINSILMDAVRKVHQNVLNTNQKKEPNAKEEDGGVVDTQYQFPSTKTIVDLDDFSASDIGDREPLVYFLQEDVPIND